MQSMRCAARFRVARGYNAFRNAPAVTGRNIDDLIKLADTKGWPGYFGTPSIASAAAGSRGMNAIAQAAVGVALDILNGASDSGMSRVADLANDPSFKPIVDKALEHDRAIEKRQADWLARHN